MSAPASNTAPARTAARPAWPTLFVPHGAPTFALHPGAAGAALTRFAAALPRPRAVLVVSAHWSTDAPTVGGAEWPATVHDFHGFPPALAAIRYPAPGAPALADEIAATLAAAGFAARVDRQRGLDHGAWIPLRLLYPEADVPVLTLSLQAHRGAEHHLRLGRALTGLPAAGVLLVASGNLTHNLADFRLGGGDADTLAYVGRFADWVWQQLERGSAEALLRYRGLAPDAARAHPSEEHLLPLFVALGAAGNDWRAERIYSGIDDRVLAMDSFAFRPRNPDNANGEPA
ncbi:dioxygenase [Azospira restricta]|uniref:Dioxygenase n=1 Tax=Azospira restricta TaxID=404405 RepID=A0A974SPA0_9RHOO|nr:class III extradiol ring-cleavage dioxygenase [Azospira restricta]QRJ63940.1 dioxygenase [Azospira restricta]